MPGAVLPVYFISHGGGPWPWMKAENGGRYDRLAESLQRMARPIGARPRAVLMVSAHWEESEFSVTGHPSPPMIYDYSNFPAHTYQIRYDAPGSPELARQVAGVLDTAGIASGIDAERGFDHGMFSPMVVIYPDADVPVIQLSLKRGLDPADHLAAGRALAPLREDDVLIIGSGLSYHNLRLFGPAAKAPSAAFDQWLQQVLVEGDPAARDHALLNWPQAPAARIAHPREEHLLPLMVAVGAAEGDAATCVYHEADFAGGVSASSFRFGSG